MNDYSRENWTPIPGVWYPIGWGNWFRVARYTGPLMEEEASKEKWKTVQEATAEAARRNAN